MPMIGALIRRSVRLALGMLCQIVANDVMNDFQLAERPLVYARLLRGFEAQPATQPELRWNWLMAAHG